MKSKQVIVLCFAIFVFCSSMQPVKSQADWESLLPSLFGKFTKLWQKGDMVFLGRPCQYRSDPKLRRLKLKYAGKVWCPGWVPYSGSSLTSSRSGSVNEAIKDFAQQLVAHNEVSRDEVAKWL